jgi:hypothetical protein
LLGTLQTFGPAIALAKPPAKPKKKKQAPEDDASGEEKAIGEGSEIETDGGQVKEGTDQEKEERKRQKKSKDAAEKGTPERGQDDKPNPQYDPSTTPTGTYSERKRCRNLIEAFGPEVGAALFAEGVTIEQARERMLPASLPSRLNRRGMGGNGLSRFMRGVARDLSTPIVVSPAPEVLTEINTTARQRMIVNMGGKHHGLARFAKGIKLPATGRAG